jgi:hypothetical protein
MKKEKSLDKCLAYCRVKKECKKLLPKHCRNPFISLALSAQLKLIAIANTCVVVSGMNLN